MKLYNSLSQKKEEFVPRKKNHVSIYVCGITPYDVTHLGHAFTYIWFDVLIRYLTFKGYKVTYTQNVTNIDDDILKRAKEENRDWKELGDFWTRRFLLDMSALNVLPPTFFVKATESIALMIGIIEVLLKKGYAYERNGSVYYDITKFKSYGKLSRFNEKQMLILSKERGGNPEDPLKKNPLDFVLWQKSKPNEPYWESPWARPPATLPNQLDTKQGDVAGEVGRGFGRPGWHIECSALIHKYLGPQIDIHGGGLDLIFPHHESEIAQSEIYTGKKPFVSLWMHTEMVSYLGEKMAKSLGNLVMISDLHRKFSVDAIRFVLLSHHYRESWEFKEKEMYEAETSIARLKNAQDDSSELPKFIGFMDNDLQANLVLKNLRSRKFLNILGFT